jgi:subtilisin family serine protease
MTDFNTARTTGRSLVLFREDAVAEGVQALASMTATRSVDAVSFCENLGVAVVDVPPEQLMTNARSISDSSILIVEPERYVYPIVATSDVEVKSNFDELETTWGLQATGVSELDKSVSGIGIKIAIIDSGLDLAHPDFQRRKIVSKSFVEDALEDGSGHGTHCAGTAAGPLSPIDSPRYGIAYDAELYIAKVFPKEENAGATDNDIIQAMEWAIKSGCHIISMSLGAVTSPGDTYSRVYEAVARRALNRGTLIIAAAGNSSNRAAGVVNPVAMPANSPSVMAVAAIDSGFQVANFSDGGINPEGGEINIAAPGVDVYSSVPMPRKYARFNGTSMATPHVTGIAALYAQVTGFRGQQLWDVIIQNAQDIGLPAKDVGAGLVQAPPQS